MIRTAVHRLHVNVCTCAARKALKEIGHEFSLQITDEACADLGVDGEGSTATKIDGGNGQRFIHGHDEISGTQNAALVAERAVKRLAKRNTHVFDRVVLIHIEIAIAFEVEIEGAVARKQLQHVIEEANTGRNLVTALAFNGEFKLDARFSGISYNHCAACSRCFALLCGHALLPPRRRTTSASWRAAVALFICSRVPMVMRTRPSQPGSLDRSRTNTPAARMRRTNSACCAPISTRIKFARLGQRRTLAVSSAVSNSVRAASTSLTYQSRYAVSLSAGGRQASASELTL